jgi:hypothetical protein
MALLKALPLPQSGSVNVTPLAAGMGMTLCQNLKKRPKKKQKRAKKMCLTATSLLLSKGKTAKKVTWKIRVNIKESEASADGTLK